MTKAITFIGMDVHAASITLAVLGQDESQPEILQIPNSRKDIRRTFERLSPKRGGADALRCCYEAGSCGFEPYRQLRSMGISCEVIAPSLIPKKPGERIKTDRRDAIKLATCYRANQLTAIHVPDEDQEAVRDLVRAREDVRGDLIAARHRLSKFLLRHGRHFTEGKNWTQRHFKWVGAQSFERRAELVTFEHYLQRVLDLQMLRSQLDQEILECAQTKPYRASVDKLCCLRGISTLSAMGLLVEIHDFHRFAHPRELMGFLGLVPTEHSSGGKERRGHITKAGNSHARRVLIEAAWSYRHPPRTSVRAKAALRKQPSEVGNLALKAQHRLNRRFARLVSRGKKSQLAVTAVARELCGFVWALMTSQAPNRLAA
jgi:transposase